MVHRSATTRRADGRSLLLLTLAIAPALIVAWFSLQQWNDTGNELATVEDATGPVSATYAAYSVVNVISRAELTLGAASLPEASPEILALAEAEKETFASRLDVEIREFKTLIPELAGTLGQSSEQTVELLELAGGAATQSLNNHDVGQPVPPILGMVVGPAREQLVSVVAPTVVSPVFPLRDPEQRLLEMVELDSVFDSDLQAVMRGERTGADLEIEGVRRVRWNTADQEWTLAFTKLSGETDISQLDTGSLLKSDNPLTPPLLALANLGLDAVSAERNELILMALDNDVTLGRSLDDAHMALLTQADTLRNDLQREQTIAALAGLLMTALGVALFGLTLEEIRDRRRVARAHDAALAEMEELANRDSLTGLLNRRWLDVELSQALTQREPGQEVGLVYVDVDRFKGINDVWGHQIGDVVLRVVAQRMRKAAAQFHDLELVRFGGDEFVGLVTMPPGSTEEDLEEAGQLLLSAFEEPISHDDRVHSIECSIGLTLSTPDSTQHSLLVEADLSLLEAKRTGRGRAVLYRRGRSQVGELVQALPEALAGGEFGMHLQPVVDVASGEVRHYEALARWTRPSGETVPPSVFVPLIESFGLADDLTRAMLVNISKLLSRSPEQLPRIWINVSPVEFNGLDLSGRLLASFEELGIDPNRLGIEMTERSAIGDVVGVEDELMRLRSSGVQVAIDDFGAGYSPLGHLRDLPVDVLKIDRSLIADIDDDAGAQQIVRGIIGFARNLGLTLIAEGVERDEELAFLRQEGIDMVQGWLTGRPAPAADILGLTTAEAKPVSSV